MTRRTKGRLALVSVVLIAIACPGERRPVTRREEVAINRRVVARASKSARPGTPGFVQALRDAAAVELKVKPRTSGPFDNDPRFVVNLADSIKDIDHHVIWDGAPDDDDKFKEAVAVLNDVKQVICSGTIVAPNRILTMAHCVGAASVVTANTVFGRAQPIEVTPSAPFFVGGNADLGVMMLFPKDPNTSITASPRPFASASLINGCKSIVAVGYGRTETGRRGKRIFTDITVVSPACNQVINRRPDANIYGCVPNFEMVASDETINREHDTCHGDSGGPALIDQGNSSYAVAALIRQEIKGKDCGAGSTFVRMDSAPVQEWIKTVKPPMVAAIAAGRPSADLLQTSARISGMTRRSIRR